MAAADVLKIIKCKLENENQMRAEQRKECLNLELDIIEANSLMSALQIVILFLSLVDDK